MMPTMFRNTNLKTLRFLLCSSILLATLCANAFATAVLSSVQVQMGSNMPVGRVLSLELTVNSVQIISAQGVPATLVSHSFTMEQSHLAASAAVVAHADILSGTYTKAIVNVSNPHVIFLDNFGNIREARWTGSSVTTVVLKKAISATSSASVIRINLNIASLLGFDPTHQSMLRTLPTFTVVQLSPGRAGADAEVSGELEVSAGKVTSVTAVSFTVSDTVSGLTTTYLVDRNTAYNGLSLRTMQNLLVMVHSATRTDGQSLAQVVSVVGSGSGSAIAGVITSIDGTTVASQQVYGAGASVSTLGAAGKVYLDPAASFEVDSHGMNLAGLNYTFGPENMIPGQRIQFISRSSMQSSFSSSANLHAQVVRLQLQSISGTVSNIGVASNGGMSFDLQLTTNDGSPLTSLGEGNGLIQIVTQPLTKSALTLSEGMQIKVRGLLLYDATQQGLQGKSARAFVSVHKDASNYYMVARTLQLDNNSQK